MFPGIPRLSHPLAAIPAGIACPGSAAPHALLRSMGYPGEVDALIRKIVEAARRVHETLGPGFLERVYARALLSELRSCGLAIERERQVRIWYGSFVVGKHSLDLIVERTVVIELKATHALAPIYGAQLRSYLRATVPAEFSSTSAPWLFSGK